MLPKKFHSFYTMKTLATTMNFLDNVFEFDYNKFYNQAVSYVLTVAAVIAAIATVIQQKWMQYDCNERLQLFAIDFYNGVLKFAQWLKEVAIPFVKTDILTIKADVQAALNKF